MSDAFEEELRKMFPSMFEEQEHRAPTSTAAAGAGADDELRSVFKNSPELFATAKSRGSQELPPGGIRPDDPGLAEFYGLADELGLGKGQTRRLLEHYVKVTTKKES